jgi:hypothetical protein
VSYSLIPQGKNIYPHSYDGKINGHNTVDKTWKKRFWECRKIRHLTEMAKKNHKIKTNPQSVFVPRFETETSASLTNVWHMSIMDCAVNVRTGVWRPVSRNVLVWRT